MIGAARQAPWGIAVKAPRSARWASALVASKKEGCPLYPALDWQTVADRRHQATIGCRLHYQAETDSTSTLAASLLPGAPPGMVVVADYQTAGRGRLGRAWLAPFGSSLTFTVILPARHPLWVVPMATGLALVDALAAHGIEGRLKWPNDALVGGKKCAGVLIESASLGRDSWMLIGIGLNVRTVDPSLPLATYLDAHLPMPLSREALLVTLLARLEARLAESAADAAATRSAWKVCLATLGQVARAQGPAGPLEGLAEDVAEDGGLILRLADGSRRTVWAGDVTLARPVP
jgi:BirA family transcriptional regulator, biotin operon repressor / biotin---[acetyl-CoA-carboxylase] ligase